MPNDKVSLVDDDVDAVVMVVLSSFIIGALLERFRLTGESTSIMISDKFHTEAQDNRI